MQVAQDYHGEFKTLRFMDRQDFDNIQCFVRKGTLSLFFCFFYPCLDALYECFQGNSLGLFHVACHLVKLPDVGQLLFTMPGTGRNLGDMSTVNNFRNELGYGDCASTCMNRSWPT